MCDWASYVSHALHFWSPHLPGGANECTRGSNRWQLSPCLAVSACSQFGYWALTTPTVNGHLPTASAAPTSVSFNAAMVTTWERATTTLSPINTRSLFACSWAVGAIDP